MSLNRKSKGSQWITKQNDRNNPLQEPLGRDREALVRTRVGDEQRDILLKSRIMVQVKGLMNIQTVWGMLRVICKCLKKDK